jgi:hypothetical protein
MLSALYGSLAPLKMRFRKECWFESGQGHHHDEPARRIVKGWGGRLSALGTSAFLLVVQRPRRGDSFILALNVTVLAPLNYAKYEIHS